MKGAVTTISLEMSEQDFERVAVARIKLIAQKPDVVCHPCTDGEGKCCQPQNVRFLCDCVPTILVLSRIVVFQCFCKCNRWESSGTAKYDLCINFIGIITKFNTDLLLLELLTKSYAVIDSNLRLVGSV